MQTFNHWRLITYTCAINYFSAVKNHYIDEFCDKKGNQLAYFDLRTRKQYQGKIRTFKCQQACKKGKKVVDSKEMATEDEQRALAAICLWNGTTEEIIFLSKQITSTFRSSMLQGCQTVEEGPMLSRN